MAGTSSRSADLVAGDGDAVGAAEHRGQGPAVGLVELDDLQVVEHDRHRVVGEDELLLLRRGGRQHVGVEPGRRRRRRS